MAVNATLMSADAFAITPVTSLSTTKITAYGFFVGTGGNIQVLTSRGNKVVFHAVATSAIIPLIIAQVHTTNTTASNIVGFGPQ